ncbi:hypothetical protein [Chondromyces crocatus]|uniref:3-oxoacyl-ACP synthase n=1 Tax=Chondromyces crocatus TaxID=52 RepID=A0A0K1EIP7_CHOCO|nr:hypothetical protein [Chondromyces crocatus]AKT40736.1 uncharacterized protein CMC5_048920 [Chondromyces crocatus]
MRPVPIVGIGLVSPVGLRPAEHAFFVRAETGAAAPGEIADAAGERIDVAYCPWIPAGVPLAERLVALAGQALDDALASWRVAGAGAPPQLLVCTAAPREGLSDEDRLVVERALAARVASGEAVRRTGAAGFFLALAEAEALLAREPERAVVVVAVDSLASVEALAAFRAVAESPWDAHLPRPSEAAAVVVLASPQEAARRGVRPFAELRFASVASGASNDDNDAVIDGGAMSSLLERVAPLGPLGAVFGPHEVAGVRQREWALATARCVRAIAPEAALLCLESDAGWLGAAAGAAHLVFGLAVARSDALPEGLGPSAAAPIGAWAISADGTRGLCVVTLLEAAPGDPALVGPEPAPRRATRDRPVPLLPVERRDAMDRRDAAAQIEAFHGDVVAGCLERLGMLLRHRRAFALAERPEIDARLLAQLDAIAEASARPGGIALQAEEDGEDDPWMLAAGALALAACEGPTFAEELIALLASQEGGEDVLAPVADALVIAPYREPADVFSRLTVHASPFARAIGVEVASRLGLLVPVALSRALDDTEPQVLAAALRALARGPRDDTAIPRARALLRASEPALVWEAARLLSLWGLSDVYEDIRQGGGLARALGPRALDILVLRGSPADLAAAQAIVRRAPPDEDLLDAVARLGSPGSWAWLLHYLDDPELDEAAAAALVTLFGPAVPEDDRLDAARWRDALPRLGLDVGGRYRGGQLWSLRAVASECASEGLSAAAIALRLDELGAHMGVPVVVNLAAFGAGPRAALAALPAAIR